MAGSGSCNCQCVSLVFRLFTYIKLGIHIAIKRPALDHPHPRLLISAVGLLKHPICSKLVELFTGTSSQCFELEHRPSVVVPVLYSHLVCPAKGHGLRIRRISYC